LQLSEEGRKVTKIIIINEGLVARIDKFGIPATARAKIGWKRGNHEFKLKLNGTTSSRNNNYNNLRNYFGNVGVTSQEDIGLPGETYYYSSSYYQSSIISGAEKSIPPNSIFLIVLDCDLGIITIDSNFHFNFFSDISLMIIFTILSK
jgi:hypothetical protein